MGNGGAIVIDMVRGMGYRVCMEEMKRAARIPKPIEQQRRHRFVVLLTDAERDLIRQAATVQALDQGEWARRRLLPAARADVRRGKPALEAGPQ